MLVSIPGKGTLQGSTLLDSPTKTPKCHRFSAVPFALPPTGNRRWRKPDPLPPTFSYGTKGYIRRSGVCPPPRVSGVTHDEDCLQSNIYVPIGRPPPNGWPVIFYIHGGFLQFGSNNYDDPSALLADTDVKCIFVVPGYRLGIFGFLASRELWENSPLAANFGFWDQRLALEWAYENIEHFGGDKNNITVGGLSAGSYATFHQLAYDIGPNSNNQIIRRVFQWSNGCGVEPKRLPEVQDQFDDLLSVLQIQASWGDSAKLEALREKTSDELVDAVGSMKQKFFRPILDGNFVSEDLFENIFSGKFGQRLHELNIQTIIGDLTQEFHGYENVFPPNSYESLVNRLSWDYPRDIATTICLPYRTPAARTEEEWKAIFGKLYADMQIHSTMRGLIQSLIPALPLSHIHRYRIDWRTKSVDKRQPPEFGATHGTDLSIWLFGNGDTLTDSEKILIREWLKPVASFIRGEKVNWGTSSVQQVRYLTSEGEIEIKDDEAWESKLPLWDLTKRITRNRKPRSKL